MYLSAVCSQSVQVEQNCCLHQGFKSIFCSRITDTSAGVNVLIGFLWIGKNRQHCVLISVRMTGYYFPWQFIITLGVIVLDRLFCWPPLLLFLLLSLLSYSLFVLIMSLWSFCVQVMLIHYQRTKF